jgi:hypothetical protein
VREALGSVVALALLASTAGAQDDCFPPRSSNEARTMAVFAVPLAFSAAGAPAANPAGRFFVGLEASYVPKVDPAIASPDICIPGKGPENTDLVFAMPRPRVSVTLPAGFLVEASWIPPLRISEAKANLVGVALSRTTALRNGSVLLDIRAHGTFGVIHGPITCDDAALQEATSECYLGTRSDDAFKPNMVGLQVAVGWKLGPTIRPYVGGGYNHLAPRFQVNFTNQAGSTDRRKVTVDLERAALFAGASWQATSRVELSGEIYSAPTDAVTGRVVGRIRLGR